ncbi:MULTISPECIES: SRPBCC family protein [unclassified Amycolatopsis]|uniref:SRPBCC family protein n=1 Tax=unclassified Amycolatopsis TaxID=2618356 RepID=UPI001EE9658C|nr:SRPBCC family protein [Amycolatopsis sp. Poz14]MCG3755221.1 SRPBCC family protein [Amycolatopsis sp. Poz14]
MWTTDYSAETSASPEAVWAALRALHSGTSLSERSDRFELHGPFEKGTELSVTPQGQDTFRSRITELTENEVYEDETRFGDVVLRFRHTLAPLSGGGTRVTHRLEIEGSAGPELGPQISEDFPVAMSDLLGYAERSAR